MATFPKLKTGAVAQYPARRRTQFRNEAVRFVDGSEQRYRDSAGPLKSWAIALEQLDAGELAAIESFFLNRTGRYGEFTFSDPWDGREYPSCSLAADSVSITASGEMDGAVSLIIEENRS